VRKTDYFAVQRCSAPLSLSFDPPITIEASGVLDAADKALGGAHSLIGAKSRLAGRVLHLGEDYRTTATMVFRPGGTSE
jgi:hypothetical protein